MAGEQLPDVEFEDVSALDAWLLQNHSIAESIWGIFWKKATPNKYIDRATLVKTVLRYGWIDSLPRRLDDKRSKLLLSPRKPGSAWSAVNKKLVQELINEGTLHPAGKAAIEAAKKDGSWSALDEIAEGNLPDDLVNALKMLPAARANFDAFPWSVRRGILEWITLAKKPETRAKRVEETAELAAQNKRALDWRAKKKLNS
ncbi:MAG: YdeI/OmpD-associated family protein [Pseudomonadota bacterium]